MSDLMREGHALNVPADGAYALDSSADTKRLDELERICAKGATVNLFWLPREKSTMEDFISYDIPAGFYWNDGVEGGPYPTVRAAIDAGLAATAP